MSYLTQKDVQIGTESWDSFQAGITGFDNEFGYVYDLTRNRDVLYDPLIDHPGVFYSLRKINSKSKVDLETTFEITLSIKHSYHYQAFIRKDESSN